MSILVTHNEYLDKKIEEVGLSFRIINAFRKYESDIKTVGDLVLKSEKYIRRIPDIGSKSLNEIKEVLIYMDLHLDMEIDLERKLHSDMKQINQVKKTGNCYEDLTYNIIKISENALIDSFNKIIKKREWNDQDLLQSFSDHEKVLNMYKTSLRQLERIVD